jgi:hypothetical protein
MAADSIACTNADTYASTHATTNTATDIYFATGKPYNTASAR